MTIFSLVEEWLEPELEVWLARVVVECRSLPDAEALIMRMPYGDRIRYTIEPRWEADLDR